MYCDRHKIDTPIIIYKNKTIVFVKIGYCFINLFLYGVYIIRNLALMSQKYIHLNLIGSRKRVKAINQTKRKNFKYMR